MELAVARKGRNDTQLAAEKRFGKYKGEEEKKVRAADVKEDEVLQQLKEAWRKYKSSRYLVGAKGILEAIGDLEYTSRDVEAFSIIIEEFQDDESSAGFSADAGKFLTVLINNCKDDDFVIHTNHLKKPPNYFGFDNTKNIIVKGDLLHYVGEGMTAGSITVEGNVGDYVGFAMQGGEIHLNGDYERISSDVRGGRIYHKGILIRR